MKVVLVKNEIVKGVALNIAFSVWIVDTDICGEGKELKQPLGKSLSTYAVNTLILSWI